MAEPVCLIDTDMSGQLCVRREAVEILEKITQPVVVVAIAGLYRTGKSYLMNRLAGKQRGFALGATIESKTKGIWMWCVPHPTKGEHTLVLVDTEGLGDVDKGDEKHDTWIFCLAVLLSCTLVYNSMGTIDNDALEKLHYVTELTKYIKVKSDSKDKDQSKDFMSIFPSFIWVVRDFTLTLELEGRPITADQYLDSALKLKKGSSPEVSRYNQLRTCLREYFSGRKCFVLERPASSKKMKQMEQLTDADLDPSFVEQAQDFCTYVFKNIEAKTMSGGLSLTGRMWGNLAETYVEAIRSGQVPCLDNAVESLALIQNGRAITEALQFYQSEMSSKVQLPTETQEELSDIHAAVVKETVEIFLNASFNDRDQKHQQELMENVKKEYEEYCRRNVEESRKMSKSIISRAFASVETAVKEGSYMRPGGYADFRSDVEKAIEQYRSEKGHGIMKEEVLKEYMDENEGTTQSILSADKSLTESEQHIEAERLKTEALEQNQRVLEEQNKIQQKQIADQEKTYEENLKQLEQKMREERKRAQEDYARVLNAKMKEQKDLLEEGFKKRSDEMQRQIAMLSSWPLENNARSQLGCSVDHKVRNMYHGAHAISLLLFTIDLNSFGQIISKIFYGYKIKSGATFSNALYMDDIRLYDKTERAVDKCPWILVKK
ncbi:guanylate-binding protein 1-like [Chanos chanos]|uniref:Guanylate-binding protein 1-like n=1 Tax=Chanos chanos TaxID=29144 RepID=A0A6J2WAH5_CHACN|nr:guanylate-binding protein 1-like [Chanos chanos]